MINILYTRKKKYQNGYKPMKWFLALLIMKMQAKTKYRHEILPIESYKIRVTMPSNGKDKEKWSLP